jgi:hypothetical protein
MNRRRCREGNKEKDIDLRGEEGMKEAIESQYTF